jgi:hypothetical protein
MNEKNIKKEGAIMADKIGIYAKKVQKTMITTIKKILAGVFGFFSFAFICFSVLFYLVKIPGVGTPFIGVGIFFSCLAIAMFILSIFMLKTSSGTGISKLHYSEIHESERLLQKIKIQLDSQNIKNEFVNIYNTLSNELENAKKIAVKIDDIQKTLKAPEWDINEVVIKIDTENRKQNPNQGILVKLNEQKENISKLKQRQEELSNQITLLKTNFNSIYTKITLLDTTDRVSFDQIETEIQKMLDFKLKVSKYEEELDKGDK